MIFRTLKDQNNKELACLFFDSFRLTPYFTTDIAESEEDTPLLSMAASSLSALGQKRGLIYLFSNKLEGSKRGERVMIWVLYGLICNGPSLNLYAK